MQNTIVGYGLPSKILNTSMSSTCNVPSTDDLTTAAGIAVHAISICI